MEYKPIDCNSYDFIEHYATLGHPVRLVYTEENGTSIKTLTKIVDTHINPAKVEFLIISNGTFIRMDYLIQLEYHQF